MSKIVGIDLGTTNSLVAIVDSGIRVYLRPFAVFFCIETAKGLRAFPRDTD